GTRSRRSWYRQTTGPAEVHGYAQTRYRARRGLWAGEETDLYQYLDLQLGNPDQEVSGALFLRGNTAVNDQRLPGDPLRGIDDTFGDPEARLYYGYVDVRDVGAFERIRAGRQSLQELPGIWFDGVKAELTGSRRTHYSFYGGRSVHLYEDHGSGDRVLGLAAEHTVNERLRARFDVASARDRLRPYGAATPPSPPAESRTDLMMSLAGTYTASKHLELDARATRLDGKLQTLTLAGNFRYPDQRLHFTVWGERQPSAFFGQTTEFSPFFDVLGAFSPYTEVGTRVTRSWDDVDVTLGATTRSASATPGAANLNQDFDRFFTSLYFPALLGHPKTSLTVSYDRYLGDSSALGSVGGELGYNPGRSVRLCAGSSYSLYEFDPITGLLRDHVREHYLAADWKVRTDWRLRSRLAFEPFEDGDSLRMFELSARYIF
ncbi:MAG: hypothetical protein HY814_03360, partial [Candidatus Riflebacteria bacterium]|nr:hypothetical protein [Candidatus Riflebacteria bacterium]